VCVCACVCLCVCVCIIGRQDESARVHAAMEHGMEQLAEVQADAKERGKEKCAMETLQIRLKGLVSQARILFSFSCSTLHVLSI
jgi:hypothetical protein